MSITCRRCKQHESHNRGLCVDCRKEVYSQKGPGEGYAFEIGDRVADVRSDEILGVVVGFALTSFFLHSKGVVTEVKLGKKNRVKLDLDGEIVGYSLNRLVIRTPEGDLIQRADNWVYFHPCRKMFLQRKRDTPAGEDCFECFGDRYDFDYGTSVKQRQEMKASEHSFQPVQSMFQWMC